MAKNQARAKQHVEAETLPFEYYSLSSSMLSFKINRRYSILKTTKTSVPVLIKLRLIMMKMRLNVKNWSSGYNINGSRPRHGHKYTKYIICHCTMMVKCITQHLSNI